jgi:ubiquinone/menaquinone biosynthesis C-methylase UbiE
MSFYQSIAPYYHHIFKMSQPQIDFVREAIPEKDAKIVEIGCGIGTLSFELALIYQQIVSIDLDAEMIAMAKSNTKNTGNHLQFLQMNMMDLEVYFEENSIDGLICFGNTLVHLSSLKQVSNFLKTARKVLKPNGKLLIQIVNYDSVFTQQITQLPLIENDEIIFERNYTFRSLTKLIDFHTTLTVKKSGKQIKNKVVLLPILHSELKQLLTDTGFKNHHFFGNFTQQAFDVNSQALVVTAW